MSEPSYILPLFPFFITSHIPYCPTIPLPSPLSPGTLTDQGLFSPGFTPEPYAEQGGVALAAESGNTEARTIDSSPSVIMELIHQHYQK